MSFTAGVGSAGKILAAVFVDFQIVGDILAVRTIANNQSIRWMAKAEVFHEILQVARVLEQTQAQTQATILSVAQRNRPARLVTGSVTEICGRDFLTLVLPIGNSNEIPERTATTALEGACPSIRRTTEKKATAFMPYAGFT
jgi:hypothetical protein